MSEISNAMKQICSEKGLSYDAVLETIEAALAAAYRKDFGNKSQNIKVEFDPETAELKVYDVKEVVEDLPEEEVEAMLAAEAEEREREKEDKEGKKRRPKAEPEAKAEEPLAEGEEEVKKFNPKNEIQIKDAVFLKKDAQLGEEIRIQLEVPGDFGRMAAQTAKQVIIQKLREAERDMVYNEFKDKEHEVISGVVQRKEGRVVLVDLGKSIGVLPPEEQIPGEVYKPGARLKVFVKEVRIASKGPEVVLSRTSDEILKKIFYLEIPEISNGLIEIKSVAREAGSRSKVAVYSDSENVDPIGSCVGQRGARIQTIISELGGEKIDIIEYDADPVKFIANALSPAKVIAIDTNEKEKKAVVTVNSDQFSLAIGKNGQNVRLAAHLAGWKIDILENKKIAKDEASAENEIPEGEDAEIEGAEMEMEDVEAVKEE